jgi:hypothetical protein
MARPQAIEKAYFYPTPDNIVRAVGRKIQIAHTGTVTLCDPCAGTGAALTAFADACGALALGRWKRRIFAAELDVTRFNELKARDWATEYESHVVNGDAFRIEPEGTVDLLFMNPPYDFAGSRSTWRRLETKWLAKFGPMVSLNGIMVFVIPSYVVEDAAPTFLRHFHEVQIARFPGAEYDAFKQVVLMGRRCMNRVPAAQELADLIALAATPLDLPNPDQLQDMVIADSGMRFSNWTIGEFDQTEIRATYQPWLTPTRRGIETIPNSVATLGTELVAKPRFKTLMPPRASHIAAAVAAGAFDGAVLQPDDQQYGLPVLAIRGSYDRVWVKTDERRNKKGELVGEQQQQVPELTISAIDLTSGEAFALARTIDPVINEAGEYDITAMSCGDLLRLYGSSMRRVFRDRTDVIFDPAVDSEPVETVKRTPFERQHHVCQAVLRSWRWRHSRGVQISGETGTGKTTISSIAAYTRAKERGGGRVLIIAPRDLIGQWGEKQLPDIIGHDVDWTNLESITDIDAWMARELEPGAVSFGILARSLAKLGYFRAGIEGEHPRIEAAIEAGEITDIDRADEHLRARCPKCGTSTEFDAAALQRRKIRCAAETRPVPLNDGSPDVVASLCMELAGISRLVLPQSEIVVKFFGESSLPPRVTSLTRGAVSQILDRMIPLIGNDIDDAIVYLHHAFPDDRVRFDWIRRAHAYALELIDEDRDDVLGFLPRILWHCHKDNLDEAELLAAELLVHETTAGCAGIDPPWRPKGRWSPPWNAGDPRLGVPRGNVAAMGRALTILWTAGEWKSSTCGEPLWQADHTRFKRVPLIQYIHRRYRKKILVAISDEAHEGKNSDTAQSAAEQVLFNMGCEWIAMTGTTSDGFPRSLFPILWQANRDLRQTYRHGQSAAYQESWGYNIRVVDYGDSDGDIKEYGATSNRKTRTRKTSRAAPGIVPTAVLRDFLPVTATISIDDIVGDNLILPPFRERTIMVTPDPDQALGHKRLVRRVRDQLKQDYRTSRSGKLLGALAMAPTSLDRMTSDVGNTGDGYYVAQYPKDGGIVATCGGYPAERIMPKEQALIDYCRENVATGDKVIVCLWNVGTPSGLGEKYRERGLASRIESLLTAQGLDARYLEAQKVATKKRMKWIDNAVSSGIDVLIAHPKVIGTGLDNLTYFSRVVFFESPGSQPIIFRQTRGRIYRPGQTRPTELVSMVYADTLQVKHHEFLIRKAAASQSTDGHDPLESLRSVGAGDESTVVAMSLGRALMSD